MTTDALIIRENNNIGESDRFVTALSRDLGVIRASARGARELKSRHASATQLLTYSRLTIHRGRDKYIIEDARPEQVFFNLRSDIEKLALAQYFCELSGVLCPVEEPAEDFLRLMLNALYLLENNKRSPKLIKAVLELRMLGLAGFMPDLLACSSCGVYESEPIWFYPTQGTLLCDACHKGTPLSGGVPLSMDVLSAMRHILYSDFSRCFSFTMSDAGLGKLSKNTELFLLSQLNRDFKTLHFYHTML